MLPERKSPRADFHHYSNGDYFVTICTDNKRHYFGHIKDSEMFYSRIGRYCREQLENLPEHYKPEHYKYVQVPLFVVMPNHVHAVISVDETFLNEHAGEHLPTIRTALSVVIGGFKRSVTMYARRNNIEFYWQSRYHDHIIRGVNDGNKISDYILNNVYKWRKDSLYSEEPNNI